MLSDIEQQIYNGDMQGDECGKFTYVDRVQSIIDYVFGEEKMREIVSYMEKLSVLGLEHFLLMEGIKAIESKKKEGEAGQKDWEN